MRKKKIRKKRCEKNDAKKRMQKKRPKKRRIKDHHPDPPPSGHHLRNYEDSHTYGGLKRCTNEMMKINKKTRDEKK